MNKKLKVTLEVLILLLIVVLVLYFSLKDNFTEVVKEIIKLNPLFIIIAIALALLYRALLAVSMNLIIKSNNEKCSLSTCFKINLMTQFFNGITPFATGGQPSQLYYLSKEGLPVGKSTNIILQNFIVYQISLVTIGLFAIIYNNLTGIFLRNDIIRNLVLIGFIINTLVAAFLFLISFAKKFNKFIFNKCLIILNKIRIIKDIDHKREILNKYLNNFYDNGLQLSKNKKVIFQAIIVNILALISLYSIPLIIIYGMGDYHSLNLIETIVSSAYVMVMGSFVPTPGGAGGIEYGFLNFYGCFIKGTSLTATMLLWRSISYYLGMVIGGLNVVFYKRRNH